MKKITITLFLVLLFNVSNGQVYSPVVNYFKAGTPTNGVKIKTNIPFQHGLGMPTIFIEGYSYSTKNAIGLTVTWYVYNGDFYMPKMASWGGYTPLVKLAVEDGKIVIFIDDKGYYDRFSIRAYANGQGEISDMFNGWTVVDELISGTIIKVVPYENRFAGNIFFPEGKWQENGNVGIGTINPTSKLTVAGNISAREVKVSVDAGADFVFENNYNLPSLTFLENFIKENKHLPEIASAKEMKADGINLSEMNIKLLQKIEELTLYLIDFKKEMKVLKEENRNLKKEMHLIK
jgi:hypothetical protein